MLLLHVSPSYHPLGLAYFPDGAHADADELEPGIVPPGSSSTCGDDMSCPAPMYYMENKYQGTYSNNADLVDVSAGEDNFGLDEYEPLFFHPMPGKYYFQSKTNDSLWIDSHSITFASIS